MKLRVINESIKHARFEQKAFYQIIVDEIYSLIDFFLTKEEKVI